MYVCHLVLSLSLFVLFCNQDHIDSVIVDVSIIRGTMLTFSFKFKDLINERNCIHEAFLSLKKNR